jgi:hypothetical protein
VCSTAKRWCFLRARPRVRDGGTTNRFPNADMANFQTRRLSDGETARRVLSGELDLDSADALEQQVRGIQDTGVRRW